MEGALTPSPRSGAEEEEAAPAPDVNTPPVELVTTGIELEEEETVTCAAEGVEGADVEGAEAKNPG